MRVPNAADQKLHNDGSRHVSPLRVVLPRAVRKASLQYGSIGERDEFERSVVPRSISKSDSSCLPYSYGRDITSIQLNVDSRTTESKQQEHDEYGLGRAPPFRLLACKMAGRPKF